MNRENQLMLALWMTTLHLMTGSGAFRVSLQPKVVMKHVNESLELVCAVMGCPHDAHFTWQTLTDESVGGGMESNGTTSWKVYRHLKTEDEKTVVCQVKCGDKEQRTTKIQVYSFPSDPVISREDESTLKCTVLSVYPPGEFDVLWLRGDTELTGGESTFNDGEGVQDVSSVYTPSEEDLGKNLTCRVTLTRSGIPEDRRVRSVTVQYGPAFLTVSNNTVVKIGERVELRCDSDGKSNITWKLGKKEVTLLNRNKVLVIENATWSHAGVYECEASTELASQRSTVSLTVQGPPNVPKLRLSHAADPTAGDDVTITCESDSIPPGRLRLSGASLNVEEGKQSSVSINIPSIQLKHSGLFHCEAQNEFGSMTSSINVTVRAPPRNSAVLVYPSSQVMEGQNMTVHCSTVSFPPASIALTREADGFQFRSPNGIFQLLNFQVEQKGTYTVNFTNELGYEVQTFEITVKGPPNVPKLRLSHAADPTAGDNVTITCESDSIPPGRLTLSGASLNVEEGKQSSVSINIPSIQLKHSGLFRCEAQNEFGSMTSSINVTVRAPPRNSAVLVYPSSQVMEGQNMTVHCSTVSFPPASIALTREADGFQFRSPNGIFQLLNLQVEQKGTYTVNFTNELGFEVQTFEITVKAQSITPILTKTAVPAVSSVSLLTAVALLVRFLRKAKKNSGGIGLGEALDM